MSVDGELQFMLRWEAEPSHRDGFAMLVRRLTRDGTVAPACPSGMSRTKTWGRDLYYSVSIRTVIPNHG